jgi:ABC-type sugar transport system substrate-binding protein
VAQSNPGVIGVFRRITKDGKAEQVSVFATGLDLFEINLPAAQDGTLLVTDDGWGSTWRIVYVGEK